MSPLKPISASLDWTAEIVEAIRPELRARINIISPGEPGKWNATTDSIEGNKPDTTLISDRPARFRRRSDFRSTDASDETRTSTQWRATIIREDGDPVFPDGAVIVITNPHRAVELAGVRALIKEATASSESPVLFIDFATVRA
ncbi:hypothetical protein BKA24_001812 [Microbacterium marinum]|uniref:Uncharacterized protein n=1 Tax=Microbacterium marinum TaxID=421115 RepID=A0A7W7FJF4_9MICO|nr:hypothetical protein [Microbacterium marinum]MBB4667103.1 hypothetical protein [Microbacterium marinum]